MHKNCIFKLGCTFIVVMIQILCDKTFNYKRNPQPSDSENDEKANKKPDGHSSQSQPLFVTTDQPHSIFVDPSINFNNKTETLQLPPSFNLRSNQKSTPKGITHFRNDQFLSAPQTQFFSESQTPQGFSGFQTPQGFSGFQTPQTFSGSQTPQTFSGSQTPQPFSGFQTPQHFSGSQILPKKPKRVLFVPTSQSDPNQTVAEIHSNSNDNEDVILNVDEIDETLV